MGKNTDKLYITHSEWSSGGFSGSSGKSGSGLTTAVARTVSALPFWTCSISQQPIQKDAGMADIHGNVYDVRNILPYIRKNGVNPVTGEKMTNKDLIKLRIEVNNEGKYIDPMSFKEFQTLSKVVLIKPSGRVYFEDTVKEHNIQAKYMKDLVSDEDFTKADIIRLQGGVGISTKANQQPNGQSAAKSAAPSDRKSTSNVKGNGSILKTSEPSTSRITNKVITTSKPHSMLTTHHMASSLTSTAMDPSTKSTFTDIPIEKLLKQKKFLEPGYASIETSLGTLNIELYPKYSPKAVYNFVELAKQGYYNGIKFHRNIKHFMIQTGDPTGTGSGGRSAFPEGKPFADETNTPLKHDERGILSMANKGKNTNTSQFFITYRRTPHLDGKHTVFGKVVGGLSVLDDLERVPVTTNDVPTRTITMDSVKILVDPFAKGLYDEDQKPTETKQPSDDLDDTPWLQKKSLTADGSPVIGKYLKRAPATGAAPTPNDDESRRKRVKTNIANSSFAGW
ncbi:peptidylprolyl isomerase CPR2 [Sugiyamaella lignohabitans]|uniref:Peptidylprolyl isomerase CPR2 n=1 Tax=Sugiyamaella lignohabitans TaxID=796027 RepID=A0A167D018_9ASCO|nr:peptidylprolyl isomerase CPR2 [Sugiyamaella lignohabitans]ANB12311.1 peptidylprolyl isomerase CPR2 [Sugiyamaella lignohabitans]